MSFTLCSSGAIVRKAGANVNSSAAASGVLLAEFCDEAEGALCAITRYDWVTNYASVKASFKPILTDIVSDLAAMKLISYDMSGYTQLTETQTMLNVMFDNIQRNLGAIKPKENQDVMF